MVSLCVLTIGVAVSWADHIRRLHVRPPPGRQHSFVEIDQKICSTVFFSFPLIQEGQIPDSGERMCSILLCFRHLSESRFLLDAFNRRSKFANFCHDLMQIHLS